MAWHPHPRLDDDVEPADYLGQPPLTARRPGQPCPVCEQVEHTDTCPIAVDPLNPRLNWPAR